MVNNPLGISDRRPSQLERKEKASKQGGGEGREAGGAGESAAGSFIAGIFLQQATSIPNNAVMLVVLLSFSQRRKVSILNKAPKVTFLIVSMD